jgi:uncharacterized SAM-binding protein YcdF (DUF218 family)
VRLRRAGDLYKTGGTKAVILTGHGVGGDSGATMAGELEKMGVPSSAILLETASTTTHENLVLAAPLLRTRGFHRVALVTTECHMGRTLMTARQTMPAIDWVPVAVPEPGPDSRVRKQRTMEWLKLAYYVLRGWA